MATFEKTYKEFLADLALTFPEYKETFVLAESVPEVSTRWVSVWKNHVKPIAEKDASIFDHGMEMVPGFVMTANLWKELSSGTKDAIWKYLSTLLLLSAQNTDSGFFDLSGFAADMEKMMDMLKGDGLGQFKDLFEKLGSMADTFGFKDMSGAANFKIPEKMFRGHIARIAQELVSEIKPEDFGISPELMKSNDPKAVFEFLQEVFTQKPEMLMSIAQKIANKIKIKFQRGEIRREDIIAEAEELMKEFNENDQFKDLFGSLREAMIGSEKASGNEGSARRREAQERLRKRAAEKAAKKTGPVQNTIVPGREAQRAEAEERAAAAMAMLLAEEEKEAVTAAAAAKKAGKKK